MGVLLAPKPLSFYDRMQPVPTDPWKLFNLDPIHLVLEGGRARIERALFRTELLAEAPAPKPDGAYHHLSCTYTKQEAVFYLDGNELIRTALPHYPSMSSVATGGDGKIIVKIVNFSEEPDDVTVTLDRDVAGEYTVERFSGAADAENTIECPDAVADERLTLSGASREFVYRAPGISVNALILQEA